MSWDSVRDIPRAVTECMELLDLEFEETVEELGRR